MYEIGQRVYELGPRVYGAGPGVYEIGPRTYETGPRVYEVGPVTYKTESRVYEVGPVMHKVGPGVFEEGPRVYEEGPKTYEMGPMVYKKRPRVYKVGPGGYETGCMRKKEISFSQVWGPCDHQSSSNFLYNKEEKQQEDSRSPPEDDWAPDGRGGYHTQKSSERHLVLPHDVEENDIAQNSSEVNSAPQCTGRVSYNVESSRDPLNIEGSVSGHTGEVKQKEPRTFPCSVTSKSFESKSSHGSHPEMQTLRSLFSCSECGKCFAQKSDVGHQRSHCGPYNCSICGKGFHWRSHLDRHEIQHSEVRSHTRLECGKSFKDISCPLKHQKNHTNERPYPCSKCGQSFKHKSKPIRHQGVHTYEILFSCKECGKGFKDKGALMRHQRYHANDMPYKCMECGKGHSQKVLYCMSPKRMGKTAKGSPKKQRKAIDLEMKMKIIQEYEAGKKVKTIAQDLELAHSTISTILKDKDRVKEAVKASTGFKAIITRQRKGLIHETEKLLAIWFDDQMQKKMPTSLLTIQTKVLGIFETLKERHGEASTETFRASNGWFQRFSRRFNLHNRSIGSEAEKLVHRFDDILQKGGHCPE
ncbi:uncharacterized protein [Pyxicephalus adspersus]|uniref:uncharacterized protein n=1 Tax=Pyxicephalus adspersus TaxID=30357 RepID=UPI003B5CD10C